ncbi:extracellular solute-binding protein [Microlunatus parietis]|uniref:Putative aldouronate transport system substrate-binding protein n=1 Tax=Microlunatus parietis TaxID=682979 RepID=A0A7Y9IBZ5_9ACTN|nr:extracellular solute-binding protein [Microlunatus parietis]NYE73882.1 putative aldouronate transport system substrate-binding protein [Microlunatus parietis]
MSRRTTLQTAVGLSLGAVAGCTTGTPTEAPTEPAARVPLPRYQAYAGVQPDLPSSAAGVMAGFLTYPPQQVTLHERPPATGGSLLAMSRTDGSAPPALANNRYWQELNRRLGLELQVNLTPPADYASKFATVVAGNDLPDLAMAMPGSVPRFPDLLEARFADLSELLAGDAITAYPALANIPSHSWQGAMFGGRIYGIPIHRGVVGSLLLCRSDLFRALDRPLRADDADGFVELCRGVTDARNGRWALGDPLTTLTFALEMFDGPNRWQESGGAFTSAYESPAMKDALEFVRRLWQEGLLHPDGFTAGENVNVWLMSGAIAMSYNSYNAWQGLAREAVATDPSITFDALDTPGADGGAARKFLSGGLFSLTVFKKAERARLEELLRVADWLASPFGTAEYLFVRYGIEGHNFTWEDGEPVSTKSGMDERRVPAAYLAAAPAVLYLPGLPDDTRRAHAYQERTVPNGKPDPTLGLFSNAASERGAGLDRNLAALQAEIIKGDAPVADWDAAVARWRSDGGDEIRGEYEQAYQKAAGR